MLVAVVSTTLLSPNTDAILTVAQEFSDSNGQTNVCPQKVCISESIPVSQTLRELAK